MSWRKIWSDYIDWADDPERGGLDFDPDLADRLEQLHYEATPLPKVFKRADTVVAIDEDTARLTLITDEENLGLLVGLAEDLYNHVTGKDITDQESPEYIKKEIQRLLARLARHERLQVAYEIDKDFTEYVTSKTSDNWF